MTYNVFGGTLNLSQSNPIIPIEPVGRIKQGIMFRRSLPVGGIIQLNVGQIQCLVEFIRMWHWVQSLLSMTALLQLASL